MKCNEFKECICEIIDQRLSKERTNELMEHARVCVECNFEFQSLRTAKNIVHEKLKMESVPAEVYYAVAHAAKNRATTSLVYKLFGFKLNPVLAVVILTAFAVGIYSLFFPSYSGMPEESNIVSQSLKNYRAVIGGVIKPQLVSSEDNVHTFLEKEVSFDVIVPRMTGCNSCAGVLSEFKGIKLAHVVYQVGDKNIVYIYQASMTDAMDGTTIGLPDDVKDELRKTDRYVHEYPDNLTIVMWRYNNTLCSAVSSMKKDEMIALLTDKDKN